MREAAETAVFDTSRFEFAGTSGVLSVAGGAGVNTVVPMFSIEGRTDWYLSAFKRTYCRFVRMSDFVLSKIHAIRLFSSALLHDRARRRCFAGCTLFAVGRLAGRFERDCWKLGG